MWRLEPNVDPRCLEGTYEWLEASEITEAIKAFAGAVYDIDWSDEEINRYAES
jgi:hypothetical protein